METQAAAKQIIDISSSEIGDPSVESVDGRRARSQRSHDLVVEALLDLYRENAGRPSAAAVAERAGVSVRTVFRLFEDIDSLIEIAVAQQWERIGDLHEAPDASGTREERCSALVSQRMRIYVETAPIVRGSRHLFEQSTKLRSVVRSRRDLHRIQMTEQFENELVSRGEADANELVSALQLACSFESIEFLTIVEGLSSEQVESVVNRTMLALLASS
ncbi:MAG: TetR/AcrR family transcriptional regulator [Actinomycetes bacterium]